MKCSHCQYPETRVVETRTDYDENIRRRRECMRCGMRFTTQENVREGSKPHVSVTTDRVRKKATST